MHRNATEFFPFAMRGADCVISENVTTAYVLRVRYARLARQRSLCKHNKNYGIGGLLGSREIIPSGKSVPSDAENKTYRKKNGGAVAQEFSQFRYLPAGVVMRGDLFLLAIRYPGRNQCFRAYRNGHGVVARPESLRGDQ